jgi:hypothetical protein
MTNNQEMVKKYDRKLKDKYFSQKKYKSKRQVKK